MSEQTKTVVTFVEGEGHHVHEVPVASTVGKPVQMLPPEPALPVKVITVSDVPVALAQEVMKAAGFVAVPVSVIESLPKTHAETIMKATRTAPAALDAAAMIEKIAACTTIQDLDVVMDGCTMPDVIAVAEEKAIELTKTAEGN